MVYLGEYAAFMIYLVTTRRMSSAGAIMIGTSKDRVHVLGLRKVGPIAPKQKNWIDFELKSISLTLLRRKKVQFVLAYLSPTGPYCTSKK